MSHRGDLPKSADEVAARLQARLSAFAIVMDVTCRDIETAQRMVHKLAGGFALTPEERHEIDCIAVRLFDAQEALSL